LPSVILARDSEHFLIKYKACFANLYNRWSLLVLILCSQVDMFSYRCYCFFCVVFFVLSTVYRWIKD